MKKLLVLFPILLFLLTGYTYPDQSDVYFVDCHESTLGDVVIYIPVNQAQYLTWKNKDLINVSSSTVYGYAGSYRITFPTYDQAYFTYGSSSSRTYLDIDVIYDTNILGVNSQQINLQNYAPVIIVGFLFIFLVWRLIK